MFKEIKSIPLATFMSRLGHEPVRRCGDKLWYKSPLRQEHTPSFKVETTLNCWYDFGIGKGGIQNEQRSFIGFRCVRTNIGFAQGQGGNKKRK